MIDFGLSAEQFTAQYLDRKPYLYRSALSSSPIGWNDLDQALSFAETDVAAIQLFNNGQIAPQAFVDDGMELGRPMSRLNKHRFYDLLQRGATLVINRFEKYSVAAQRLGLCVSRFTNLQTTSNAYVSFGGSGTFGRHWDTHDVVVLQLAGRKHWQVFTPSWELPLSNQTSERMKLACPQKVEFDCTMETGDLLYIPRGWWHDVKPFSEGSLHLSIGVYAPAMVDYITWLCGRILPQQLDARRHAVAANMPGIANLIQAIAAAAHDQRNLDEFAKDTQRSRLISEFNTELFTANNQPALPDHARLMLTTYGDFSTEPGDEVRINGGRIRLDEWGHQVVRALRQSTYMTFAALCQRLPAIKREDMAVVVMGLARHELINVDMPMSSGAIKSVS